MSLRKGMRRISSVINCDNNRINLLVNWHLFRFSFIYDRIVHVVQLYLGNRNTEKQRSHPKPFWCCIRKLLKHCIQLGSILSIVPYTKQKKQKSENQLANIFKETRLHWQLKSKIIKYLIISYRVNRKKRSEIRCNRYQMMSKLRYTSQTN